MVRNFHFSVAARKDRLGGPEPRTHTARYAAKEPPPPSRMLGHITCSPAPVKNISLLETSAVKTKKHFQHCHNRVAKHCCQHGFRMRMFAPCVLRRICAPLSAPTLQWSASPPLLSPWFVLLPYICLALSPLPPPPPPPSLICHNTVHHLPLPCFVILPYTTSHDLTSLICQNTVHHLPLPCFVIIPHTTSHDPTPLLCHITVHAPCTTPPLALPSYHKPALNDITLCFATLPYMRTVPRICSS